MNPPNPDVLRLVEVLDRHRVEYLLVGGVAAQAYGAQRPTRDVDCLARRTNDNLERLAAAMRELNARLHVEGLTDEEASHLSIHLDGTWLARMEISTWRTHELDRLDTLDPQINITQRLDRVATRHLDRSVEIDFGLEL